MRTFENMTRDEYVNSLIAQADTGGYDPNGWIAGIHNGIAFIDSFGHCSCYDTWTAVNGGGISDYFEAANYTPLWTGSVKELIDMAVDRLDPAMPSRVSNPDDYNYHELISLYYQILKYSHYKETK